MPDLELGDIRKLRAEAIGLLSNQAQDLSSFLNTQNRLTYRRLPQQSSRSGDVKVTTSCSCLMSLTLSKQLHRVYEGDEDEAARRAFERIFGASWRSSGLGLNNAFSTVLVLRTFGLLVQADILRPDFAHSKARRYTPLGKATLQDIAAWLSGDITRFRINKYPPSAALVYWFVDAIDRGRIRLGPLAWERLSAFAKDEFNHQRSLVVAQHEALMDPIAMAMAACLCARIGKIADVSRSPRVSACLQLLPSVVELEHAIKVFFDQQGRSGIWPKYFPLFHYPKAGSNFCFTFETLEAVLGEFGRSPSQILTTPPILHKLASALNWCVANRLKYSAKGIIYNGWNSGGELESLHDGKPESWATAVVHMFLSEFDHVLTTSMQFALLRHYKATAPVLDPDPWARMLDMDVHLQGSTARTTVKKVLERSILASAGRYRRFPGESIKGPVSALLFGPPGTSKTRISQAVAAKLGWPLLLLDPSHFLSNGIENIYSRASEIFRDLQDLSGVVVLFDEMDALVRTRDGTRIDLTGQFLTTSMLPKLAALHDQGSLVFLFATNYQEGFDPAIKRPGRFDVLLCVGPPPLREKLRGIDRFLPEDTPPLKIIEARRKLKSVCQTLGKSDREILDLLTFKEMENFLRSLSPFDTPVLKSILQVTPAVFAKRLTQFSQYITLRATPSEADRSDQSKENTYERYKNDQKESRLQ